MLFFSYFAQLVDSNFVDAPAAAMNAAPYEIDYAEALLDLFKYGGIITTILLIILLYSLYLIFERLIDLFFEWKNSQPLRLSSFENPEQMIRLFSSGKTSEAAHSGKSRPVFISRIWGNVRPTLGEILEALFSLDRSGASDNALLRESKSFFNLKERELNKFLSKLTALIRLTLGMTILGITWGALNTFIASSNDQAMFLKGWSIIFSTGIFGLSFLLILYLAVAFTTWMLNRHLIFLFEKCAEFRRCLVRSG